MPRKGRSNWEKIDVAATPTGAASKKTTRKHEPAAPRGTRAGDVSEVSDFETGGPPDPIAAVLADGSDVPSQRVLKPTHDQIERRAYEVYLRRAGAPGRPEEDWYQAERELAEEQRANQERSWSGGQRATGRASRKAAAVAASALTDAPRAGEAEA